MLEICKYINEVSRNTAVRVNTNGGMRKPEWWAELGKLFSKYPRSMYNYWSVTFSIDGLEDTNHLYRRNVKWNAVIANAQAFIDAGGTAIWDYLIFKHNEHQILEAQELSKKMKFNEFVPKKSLGVDNGTHLQPMAVLDKDGQLEYIIEAPTNSKNRNLENPIGVDPMNIETFKFEDYKRLKENKEIGDYFQEQVKTVYEDRILKEDNSKYNSCSISCKSKGRSPSSSCFLLCICHFLCLLFCWIYKCIGSTIHSNDVFNFVSI
jgi:hypothetical protein